MFFSAYAGFIPLAPIGGPAPRPRWGLPVRPQGSQKADGAISPLCHENAF